MEEQYDMIRYMIYYLQLGSHPVAVVQYIYTHKQYRERHKTINTQNNTKIHRTTQQLGRVRAVPRLYGFYPGICLTTEEKARKNLSQSRRKQVNYTAETSEILQGVLVLGNTKMKIYKTMI